jgi:high-affinity iron transporter
MFLIIANVFAFVTLLGQGPAGPSQGDDRIPVVRRIAASAALAAQEYRNGVTNGRVTAAAEVEEAKLFLNEARRSAATLPPEVRVATTAELSHLLGMVTDTAPPDSVDVRVRQLSTDLSQKLGVSLDEIPSRAPSLARGAQVYQSSCAACHGAAGRGDGVAGAALNPPPSDLTDFRALGDRSPLDFYHRVTLGVAGTAMPAFETRLSSDDRWAAALYSTLLRSPAARGDVPAALREFATTAGMSDAQITQVLLPGADPMSPTTRSQIAAVRGYQQVGSADDAVAATFSRVREQLDSAYLLASRGESAAASGTAFDAYLTFERVETSVRVKHPALADQLEAGFAAYRTRAAGGATVQELRVIQTQLLSNLENAERVIGDRLSPLNLFMQSLVILLREGLEAILIIGAIVAFLMKTGNAHRRRDIHVGVGAAVLASLLTAVALETIFQISPASQEALEGATMILATAVLFYVSYWLLSKMEVAKWNRFVRGRVQDAVTSGSALALASVAFLAVYREGFETVLFYKALFLTGGGSPLSVVAGIVVGSVALVAVYIAINRYGVRIPLKPFFGFTSAFLYYMAFGFAGKGVAELQEGGIVGTTIVPWAPRIPGLGIYPTVESLAVQGLLVVLLLAGLTWTFLLEPRRLKPTQVLVPEPRPAGPPDAPPTEPSRIDLDMLRSLERMDADLAELRAEVDRLKRQLGARSSRR